MVALPQIESHFNSDLPTVQWLVIGYALAISVFLLPMGRLGDIIPRKHVYVSGFVIFVLAAAFAGASPNLWTLISAKVIQGIGSAMIQGNGMATIVSTFPGSERGKALGYHLSVVADDLDMRVTHVLRGADHKTNTFRQLMIYRALEAEPPRCSGYRDQRLRGGSARGA